MKIRYRAADLILAVSVLVVVSAIYYLGNFWLYVVGVVLAGVTRWGVNWGIVGEVAKGLREEKDCYII